MPYLLKFELVRQRLFENVVLSESEVDLVAIAQDVEERVVERIVCRDSLTWINLGALLQEVREK